MGFDECVCVSTTVFDSTNPVSGSTCTGNSFQPLQFPLDSMCYTVPFLILAVRFCTAGSPGSDVNLPNFRNHVMEQNKTIPGAEAQRKLCGASVARVWNELDIVENPSLQCPEKEEGRSWPTPNPRRRKTRRRIRLSRTKLSVSTTWGLRGNAEIQFFRLEEQEEIQGSAKICTSGGGSSAPRKCPKTGGRGCSTCAYILAFALPDSTHVGIYRKRRRHYLNRKSESWLFCSPLLMVISQ